MRSNRRAAARDFLDAFFSFFEALDRKKVLLCSCSRWCLLFVDNFLFGLFTFACVCSTRQRFVCNLVLFI